jgi:hypothetical protein
MRFMPTLRMGANWIDQVTLLIPMIPTSPGFPVLIGFTGAEGQGDRQDFYHGSLHVSLHPEGGSRCLGFSIIYQLKWHDYR